MLVGYKLQRAMIMSRFFAALGRIIQFHGIAEGPDVLDGHVNGVAGHEKDGGLASESHATGCSGKDHRARKQRCACRKKRDQFGNRENHIGSVGILHNLAVEHTGQPEILGIGEFIRSHQLGPQGAEGVKTFAAHPLT